MQGMVGPDWRVGLWTFLSIPAGTAAWACLILFGAPDDGGDTIRQVVVVIGAVIALITMGTYLSTACTDPGIVFKHEAASVTSSLPEQRFLGGRSSTVVRRRRRMLLVAGVHLVFLMSPTLGDRSQAALTHKLSCAYKKKRLAILGPICTDKTNATVVFLTVYYGGPYLVVAGTHDIHENAYIALFFPTVFWI